MATRMEKYSNNSSGSRSNRNRDLYSDIYTYSQYSNIEGVADIEKTNQVDIAKVRELLENREKYQNQRKYRRPNDYKEEKTEPAKVSRRFPELEEKNYDIRDVLKEARENKEPDDKERVLRNTQYNILKNIDLKKDVRKEDYYNESEEELKELIETIHNTSILNKQFTSTDLLSDLKDEDDVKVSEVDSVKDMMEEPLVKTRKVSTNPSNNNDITNYDRSFFTSSLKLNKSDFVGHEKSGILNKIIITLLIIIMIASAAILVMRMFF